MQVITTAEIVKHLKCMMAGFKNMSKSKKKNVQEVRDFLIAFKT